MLGEMTTVCFTCRKSRIWFE